MSMELQEGQIILEDVRVGYPTLFRAMPVKNEPEGKKRFSLRPYLPKSNKATKARIDKEIARIVRDELQGVMPPKDKIFLVDGDEKTDDDIAKGHWVISANRPEKDKQGRLNPPAVTHRNRKPAKEEDNPVYGGCRCNVLISIYLQKKWKRICAQLEVVQFIADDEPFGAPRVDPESVMPEMPDDSDGDFGI